jgi:hypothetical protein
MSPSVPRPGERWVVDKVVPIAEPYFDRARDYGYTVDEMRELWDGSYELAAIELFFDEEANNWHYRVPALHINGGGRPRVKTPSRTA